MPHAVSCSADSRFSSLATPEPKKVLSEIIIIEGIVEWEKHDDERREEGVAAAIFDSFIIRCLFHVFSPLMIEC